ncbi:MAG: MFS transporter [Chloroflexi bacterium]|nr:MAG: MFS transporter [Chloroflexota bacterium]
MAAPPVDAGRLSYRWVMLALLCAGYGSFGLVSSSLAPLVGPILRDTGMTRGEMGLVLGSWQFVYLFMAIPAGMAIDRFGLRIALFAGIALVALSQALRAGAFDQVTMLGAVMVFGLGGPFISVGAPKLVATWFSPREVGMALGVYTVSPSVGSMIVTATANSVLMPATGDSWRLTLLVFAAFAAVAAIAWLVLAREPRAAPGATVEPTGSTWSAFGALLRIRVVQVVLVMAVGCFLVNHSLNNWLPEVLRAQGMTPSQAGFWASFPTLVAIPSALLIPRLTTARWLTAVQVGLFALWAVAMLLLPFGAGTMPYLGLLLIGVGRGAAAPLLMLTLLRSPAIGPHLMGAAGGLFFAAGEVGGVLGPTLTGVLADATGGFASGLLALSVVGGLLAALALVLRSATQRESATVTLTA